jgi:hypothetical protein
MISTIKMNDPIKWTEDLNKHFSSEGMQIASKHMERWSISLVIKATQNSSEILLHMSRMGIGREIQMCCW